MGVTSDIPRTESYRKAPQMQGHFPMGLATKKPQTGMKENNQGQRTGTGVSGGQWRQQMGVSVR